ELETTPEAGLEAAQRNPPDAIITALHFGGLPAGLSFIDRLRESRETASIPIVVVSSFTDIHERELRARGVRFVQKGAHLGRIVDQLDTLLKTGRCGMRSYGWEPASAPLCRGPLRRSTAAASSRGSLGSATDPSPPPANAMLRSPAIA